MKRHGQFWTCLLASALAVSLDSPAGAQEQQRKFMPHDGTQAFRSILHTARLEPLQDYADLGKVDPKDTIIIVFGVTGPLETMRPLTGGLQAFLDKGGAVLIASDYPGRLEELGIEIGGRITAGGDLGTEGFLGFEDCPLIDVARVPFHRGHGEVDPRSAPFFENVKRLPTNRPARIGSSMYSRLAVFRPFGLVGESFMVGARRLPGRGFDSVDHRLLVMAGHGVFTNTMMLRSDTDNFLFAWNCIRWLQQSEQGKERKHALFIEEGQVVTSFDVPLTLTLPRVSLAAVLNRGLNALREDDSLNKLLRQVPRDRLLAAVLIPVTALLGLILLLRLWRGRQRVEAEAPLIEESVAGMLAELPLLTRRHHALLKSDNFYELARLTTQQFFDSQGLGAPATKPPEVKIAGGWWARRRLRRQLAWLWDLAHGPAPTPVPARRLARIADACRAVAVAVAEGLEIRQRQGPG